MKSIVSITFLILLCSCSGPAIEIDHTLINESTLTPIEIQDLIIDEEIESWTEDMRKQTILEVNNLPIDSIVTDTLDFYISQFFYSKGEKVKAYGYTMDKKDTVSFYYKSSVSELNANGETCPIVSTELTQSGSIHTYRGLKYKGKHIGIATYLNCDLSVFEKGLYYKGKRIGVWKTLDLKSNEITNKDYGSDSLLVELNRFTSTIANSMNDPKDKPKISNQAIKSDECDFVYDTISDPDYRMHLNIMEKYNNVNKRGHFYDQNGDTINKFLYPQDIHMFSQMIDSTEEGIYYLLTNKIVNLIVMEEPIMLEAGITNNSNINYFISHVGDSKCGEFDFNQAIKGIQDKMKPSNNFTEKFKEKLLSKLKEEKRQ